MGTRRRIGALLVAALALTACTAVQGDRTSERSSEEQRSVDPDLAAVEEAGEELPAEEECEEAEAEGAGEPEAESEGEGECEEGDVGGLRWFLDQRAYPDGIPPGAYRRATRQGERLPTVRIARGDRLVRTRASEHPRVSRRVATRDTRSKPRVERTALRVAGGLSGGANWTSLGPSTIDSQQAGSGFRQFTGAPPFAGRVTAIATHPTSRNIAYAGGALGGVWRTADAGATWKPVFEGQDTMSIGSIAVDRTTPTTVFVGTGELNATRPYGVGGPIDSYFGTGLFKSTNSGGTFTKVGGTTFRNCHIAQVSVAPNNSNVVLVSASSSGTQGPAGCDPGIYRSADGGTTWSYRVSSVRGALPNDFAAHSLANAPAAPDRWFVGFSGGGIFRSTDGGVTWNPLSAGLPDPATVSRYALAVDPAAPTRVYAAAVGTNGEGLGVWLSENAGDTFTQVVGAGAWFCNTQCTYDLTIGVSPSAAGVFWVGGITLTRFTNFGAASASFFDPQRNAGEGIHWDIHATTFDSAGRMWVGSDGGVWRVDSLTSAVNTNATLGLTQFYPGISGSTSGVLLGGAQDMATERTAGLLTWRNVAAGDGGYTVVDTTTSPTTYIATSQRLSLYRSTDAGETFTDYTPTGLPGPNVEARAFIAPLVAGSGNPLRMYAGLRSIWRSVDHGVSWSRVGSGLLATRAGETISAVAQAPGNANVVYAATNFGAVFVTTNALSASPTWTSINNVDDPMPARFVTDIAVDPSNAADVLLTFSGFNGAAGGHLYRSTNTGADWTDISTSLPDAPVNAATIVPKTTGRRLLAGTDVGVFVSDDNGTTWARLWARLPSVLVSDLIYDQPADRVVAATFGRGMWTACANRPKPYDTFARPRVINTSAGAANLSTRCAGKETGEPSHSPDGNPGGASVWLEWTAPTTGTATFRTTGSDFDTTLAAYQGGAVGTLSPLASNDDVSATDRTSRLQFAATAGQVYRIAVDGYLYDGYALARNGTALVRWSVN